MTVQAFDSFSDALVVLAANEKAADEAATETQKAVTIGDYFMRHCPDADVVVYGEILDPSLPAAPYDKGLSEEDLEEIRREGEDYASRPYIRFCRCFSILEPEGELGSVHVVTMDLVISRDLFEAAKALDWPNDKTGRTVTAGEILAEVLHKNAGRCLDDPGDHTAVLKALVAALF